MKNNNDFLGRRFRDIVTGYEGICTGYVEWLYLCLILYLCYSKNTIRYFFCSS